MPLNPDSIQPLDLTVSKVAGPYLPEAYAVSVIARWNQAVIKYPDRIALRCGTTELTYMEVAERVDHVAQILLKSAGYRHQGTVALLFPRSEWTCICMLGIWKAGMVYAPLSLDNPWPRNLEILRLCLPEVVIVSEASGFKVELDAVLPLVSVLQVETLMVSGAIECDAATEIDPECGDLAYLMFTSGSTGQPKGAMIEHAGMGNHLTAKITDFEIGVDSVVAQNASQSFDISVWQFLAALLGGGMTVVYPRAVVLNPLAFLEALQVDRVTVLELVPSYFSLLLKYIYAQPGKYPFEALRYLILNAETLPMALVEKWLQLFPDKPIVNTYGATETADDIGHYIMREVPRGASVPVMGQPIPNHWVYILDSEGKIAPVGEVGEIYIAGIGVGRGYLGNEAATAAAFGMDSFESEFPTKMYKTNDLGRLWPDGRLEFCGRSDRQIKIDGQRVEMEEIEGAMVAHPQVIHAVVVAQVVAGKTPRLKGFWMARQVVPSQTMREHLEQRLPPYMVPSHLEELDSFPVNANEKIDLLALLWGQ